MKKLLLTLFGIICVHALQAQVYPYCKAGLFSEYTYYSGISIDHEYDMVYGNNLDYLGNQQALTLNIHYPNLIIDPLAGRPLVVMLHGGGLLNGNKTDLDNYCIRLARAGYVAVSMTYRQGWTNTGPGGICDGNTQQFRYAVYRALQDVKAGIRYLVHQAATYRIDTANIFLAGQSEGGMTALHCAFLNQAEADLLLPGVSADLGSIDSASNNYIESFSLRGVFNWCGGILDTAVIKNDTPIPVLSIHGLHDSVMPVTYGPYLNCQNANNPYPFVFGPKAIYTRMKNLGICTEANYDADGAHCFYPSLEEQNYIPAKFTCFFKNLLCGNCITESKVSYNQKSCAEAAPAALHSTPEFSSFTIFPNPVQADFSLSFSCKTESLLKLKLIDAAGKTVAVFPDHYAHAGQQYFLLHRPDAVQKGIYFLCILSDGGSKYFKITFL